jgi:hypothetical protein
MFAPPRRLPIGRQKLNQQTADADTHYVKARLKVLRQLIRESLYTVDEHAVADAILAHARVDDPMLYRDFRTSLPQRPRAGLGRHRRGDGPR